MKYSNIFSLIGLFIVLAVLIFNVSFASSTTSSVFSISNVSAPTSVSENSGTFTFTFNLTYTGTSESRNFTFIDSDSNFGTVSIPDAVGLNGTAKESRVITGTVTNYNNQGGRTLTININASSGTTRDDESSFSVQITESNVPAEAFCRLGEKGDLRITDFIVNNLGKGDDDEWEPLDKIEMEVEMENTNNNEDVRDVLVEIKIMDGDEDVTNNFDFQDEEIDIGRIREDDSETVTFVIEELPADLDEGNYRIFVKAYEEGNEDEQCTSKSSDFDNSNNNDLYHEIEYVRDEDVAVVVRDADVVQNIQASCGDELVQVTFPVYNIGTDKEEKVLVRLTNKELNLNTFEIIDDLRSGKRKDVTFFLNIPENLDKSLYKIDITTYFEYDKDEDEENIFSYDSNSEDDLDENFEIGLEILSCNIPEPSISARLSSNAIVEEELIITSTIINNGDREAEFLVYIADFEDWAELTSEEVQTITLKAGESESITITFNPKEAGEQTFNINVITDGKTFEQSVSVNIAEEEKRVFNFEGISDSAIYLIIGIILLLILIFLDLIIRASRRNRRREFSDLA